MQVLGVLVVGFGLVLALVGLSSFFWHLTPTNNSPHSKLILHANLKNVMTGSLNHVTLEVSGCNTEFKEELLQPANLGHVQRIHSAIPYLLERRTIDGTVH